MRTNELEKMWEEFSKIKLVDNKLTSMFYDWNINTNGIDIIKWFNQKLPDGILFQNFTESQLEMLWNDFENTPINKDDEIEEVFFCWAKGTYRFDIWHWFDEKLSNGIVEWALA